MTSDFCVAALEEALARYGTPEIFNTDQGAQFTANSFVKVLLDAGVAISMDGVGRAIDNVFIERLWRTVKYDHVYLNPANSGNELRAGLNVFLNYYNQERPHSSLADMTPRRGLLSITASTASGLTRGRQLAHRLRRSTGCPSEGVHFTCRFVLQDS
jgi:putative transposase